MDTSIIFGLTGYQLTGIAIGLAGLALMVFIIIKINPRCPYCGCMNPRLIEMKEGHYDDVYLCPNCNKIFTRNDEFLDETKR
jgi:transposase-like protein